jgi:hypothetical protein
MAGDICLLGSPVKIEVAELPSVILAIPMPATQSIKIDHQNVINPHLLSILIRRMAQKKGSIK